MEIIKYILMNNSISLLKEGLLIDITTKLCLNREDGPIFIEYPKRVGGPIHIMFQEGGLVIIC